MKPFDFNVHLPGFRAETIDRILEETSFDGMDILAAYGRIRSELSALHEGANIMVFNPALAHDPNALGRLKSLLREDFGALGIITLLAPIHEAPDIRLLAELRQAGVWALKFHSYVQSIGEEHFPQVVRWAESAQEAGLALCIDTSYGSRAMYRHDNLRLAAAVLERVTRTPVILLHSGGLRIMEAMLLAEASANAWLEASFSLSYYQGSPLLANFAYAYRKIGAHRILYASDFPYVTFPGALESIQKFLAEHHFTKDESNAITTDNARRLLSSWPAS